ncbi:membrane protein containing HAMP linker domain protein, partial [Candidatus Magnetobacterium bavaricum]
MKLSGKKNMRLKSRLTILTAIPHVLAVVIFTLILADVDIAHNFLFILFAVVLLSMVLSVLALKRVMRPFSELVASARDISQTEFKHSIDNDTPDVLIGDHEMLKHVLTYIVENSIKFTRTGQR